MEIYCEYDKNEEEFVFFVDEEDIYFLVSEFVKESPKFKGMVKLVIRNFENVKDECESLFPRFSAKLKKKGDLYFGIFGIDELSKEFIDWLVNSLSVTHELEEVYMVPVSSKKPDIYVYFGQEAEAYIYYKDKVDKEHIRKICEKMVKRFGGSAEFVDDSSNTIGYKKDIAIP